MHSRRPSRYQLVTFLAAAIAGIVAGDLFFPAENSPANLLLSAAVAALMAVLMVWLGGRRRRE